jgi:hypothetical protein
MTFTGDCPEGRSQHLTCAEADEKIVIDKSSVNKLTELLVNCLYSVHISRRSEIFLTSLDMHLAEHLINKKPDSREFTEKSSLLLESYQDAVPELLAKAEGSLEEAMSMIDVFVSASKVGGNNG